MKSFKLNKLYSLMVIVPTLMMPTSTAIYASDLAIYKGSTKGKTSLLLMLDTSGSMGISSLVLPKSNGYGSPGDVTTALCDRVQVAEYNNDHSATSNIYQWAYNLRDSSTNRTAIRKTVSIGDSEVAYYVRGCSKGGVTQYDRLSRLKDAILPLLASNKLTDDLVMGLGQFSSKTELTIGTATNRLTDGHSGRIIVPNAQLSADQRLKIAQQIAAVKSLDTTTNEDGTANAYLKLSSNNYPNVTKASSGTPTAHAYAEAGAYMMGTGTGSGGLNSGAINTLYDGYMVMQNGTEQVYFICVQVGTATTGALGATVKQCINNWPGYDQSNETVSSATVSGVSTGINQSGTVYKPNGSGGWIQVIGQADFKNQVGAMTSGWQTFSKLPEGWRYGGWMKVNNEPLDIEPIVGTVWTGYAGGTIGIVSYRTNPFSISSNTVSTPATCKQTSTVIPRPYSKNYPQVGGDFQSCPSGYSVLGAYNSLCYQQGNWVRNATPSEVSAAQCLASVQGTAPLTNARNPNGSVNNNENYNKSSNAYPGGGGLTYVAGINEVTTTDNNLGGFAYSDSNSKSGNNYIAGGTTSSCDGNGIYFLTDGAPNSTKEEMAKTILNRTLNNNATYAFSAKPSGTGVLTSPALSSGLFEGETGGWEFIGEYAKKLFDRTKNPAGMQIKTAVVGFGSSFEGLTKNTDGTYDCNSTTNLDIKNACLWGQKNAGYGEGGFYQANNADDIANSIVKFVQDLDVNFSSTSLGTISIPLDPLDQTKAMNTGFFPMIQPSVESNKRTWLGNLKKYYIFNGTLTDSPTGGNKVYNVVDNQQVINSSAKDIWFNQEANNSLIDVGGALNKIPVPANFPLADNPINNVTSVRKVFVISDKSLKQVTTSNLATDIADNDQIGTIAQFPIKQRIALLNYLGYSSNLPSTLPTNLTKNFISALPIPQSPYRYLGGVVHSTPLVVTKEASINARNEAANREEYVVYGSMEGGLHVVNASSGKEASVFVPDEILKNQPETLVNSDASGVVAYGVDAPWVADNTFKVEASGSTTKYIARTMNIYGGLRMGGDALYGLDISTPTSPSLNFKITPSTDGFSQLGQIWSKPVITNIRVKGEVKKVLIFGGGYDETVFENDANKIKNVTNRTKGNALYIVDALKGTLLWSVSSSNSSNAATSNQQKQDDVKFSVVGQPTVRDYNADGLTDVIYFADLGGQIFRVDLNNAAQATSTAVTNLAVRTQTLAKLTTSSFTPRFYERLSTAVFKEGQNRFVLVTAGSGNRSYPLEKESGFNNVYGLIDYDATAKDLEKATFSPLARVILPGDLVTTGVLGKTQSKANTVSDITSLKNRDKKGWAFALKNSGDDGYVKAMEETQLINSDLYVSVYDPNALLGGGTASLCGGGIQGISTVHRVCMPYGNCAAYATTDNQGIIGVPLGPINSDNSRKTQIVSPTAITAEKCIGEGCGVKDSDGNNKPFIYKQSRVIKPIRWYEW